MASYTAFLSNLRAVYTVQDENAFWSILPGADCIVMDDSNVLMPPWDMTDMTAAQQVLMSPAPIVTGDTRTSMRENVLLGMAAQYPEIDLDTDTVTYLWL